jgi:hypothetical protein
LAQNLSHFPSPSSFPSKLKPEKKLTNYPSRTSGPTAGYDSNLTPDNLPDQQEKGGIKGLMHNIGDKLGPGHPGGIDSSPVSLFSMLSTFSC